MYRRLFAVLIAFALLAGLTATTTVSAQGMKLQKGDHIAIIGNALADRMQHDGWLETYLQAAMPSYQFSIRNLAFSGDQVAHRPRAHKAFGNADSHLTHTKANVIFAFFGYNESFSNKPDDFKNALNKWIDETNGKNYSGKGAPRIVLFSPIAHEDLKSSNLPNGKDNNVRLAAYTRAMAMAARDKKVGFVDLFTSSKVLYARAKTPLTINGIHLTTDGNRQIGAVIVKALLGRTPSGSTAKLEKIRQAVLDKNLHWFNRYRATDGNDVWGGRSKLHGNKKTLMIEMQMFDVMTNNRDKVVWAAAMGKSYSVDDSNVPKPDPVKSNYKPSNKTGTKTFLGGKEAIAKMTLAKGLKANLFASEEMDGFEGLINPVQLGVDPKGRLWAAVWPTYPKWEPGKVMGDALVILPDENGDGVADEMIIFAKVQNPTGFEFWGKGVIVVSAPDILYLEDTDGDDIADVRIRIFGGIDSADTHHTANNLTLGPDGFLYYQRGVFMRSNVETPYVKAKEDTASAMYRFNPRTYSYNYHAKNSPNPHGVSFDYWGYHFATDGTGGRAYQVVQDKGGKFKMQGLLKKTVRPVPSSGILSSAHFPERNNGNFLICNAIAFLGIKQYTLKADENGNVQGTEIENIMSSKDGNFRPTDFEIPSDGALYVSDWANPIIGHMQHNIRDPMRDHKHGRIYRFTVNGRPLSKPIKVVGQPITALLELLKNPVNGVRHRARVELAGRDSKAVLAAASKWASTFDSNKEDEAHHLLEALWLHQSHNVVNKKLLAKVLGSSVKDARIAAGRVKYMWDNNIR